MAIKQKDVIIANPMYDVVFKLLMADKDIARYFVGAVLGEEITDIDFAPQEYSYEKQIQTEDQIKTLSIIRLDFVATIRTNDDTEKKVLIEIQQSPKPYDVLRFRTYIGEQYKNKDNIVAEDDKIVKVMPIVVIYMLGFKMEETSQVAVKIKRVGEDLLDGDNVEIKNPLFEALTHDAYPITNKIIEKMVNTLERIAADPKMRRAMEEAEFAALDVAFLQKVVTRKDSIIAQKENALAQKDKEIAELRRMLGLN